MYAFAPVTARCLVYGDCRDAGRLSFCEFIKDQYSHIRIQYRTQTQLGLLERFHQTLKDEEGYYHLYENPGEARESIEYFRERYNTNRPHLALIADGDGDLLTPLDVYAKGKRTQNPRWQKWAEQAKKRLEEMLEKEAA